MLIIISYEYCSSFNGVVALFSYVNNNMMANLYTFTSYNRLQVFPRVHNNIIKVIIYHQHTYAEDTYMLLK